MENLFYLVVGETPTINVKKYRGMVGGTPTINSTLEVGVSPTSNYFFMENFFPFISI
jgi:hypothetical protein